MERAENRIRRARQLLVDYPRAVPLAIFLLIASITALSVYAIEKGENQRDRARLRETAQAVASAIERRGSASSSYLRAGAALLATVDEVEAPLFRKFVNELRLDTDYRGGGGIGWAEAVRPSDLTRFERALESSTNGFNRVRPAPGPAQRLIVPVTYLQPDTARNRLALGFDMYSEKTRKAAMDAAVANNRPTASGRIILQQDGSSDEPGFLIYMPVYNNGAIRRELKGFIFSPFNSQDFLLSALELEGRGKSGISLYDGEISDANLLAEVPLGTKAGDAVSEQVMVANHPMTLLVVSAQSGSLSQLSMATLIFGMLVATLLMLMSRLLAQQALEDRASLTWLHEQNSIRNSLTRELNHRVKNTLANVLSIIAMTRRRTTSLDDFAEGIDGRIRALSATHDLLTQSEWGTTPVKAVIEAELAPYAQGDGGVTTIAGSDVDLAPNEALSLGLAIHELATNAAKYGALSVADGKVSVTWTHENGVARIVWQESDGPPVKQDRTRGFGTDLIEKIVAHELQSPVELDFNPAGVRCVITVPIRTPSDFAMRAKRTS